MGNNSKKCLCSPNENNQMVCGSGCINAGEKCSTVKDCKTIKIKGGALPNKNEVKVNVKMIKTKKNVVAKPSGLKKTKKRRGFSYAKMTNLVTRTKAQQIGKVHGDPSLFEKDNKGNLVSVSWQNVEGLDKLTVYNDIYRKWHPYPAEVYVVAYKLIKVPDHLLGPLKYASETINIDQLRSDRVDNFRYGQTGIKGKSLVSGSCASITISAITLKFVEDMCRQYKEPIGNSFKIFKEFRAEYDKRVSDYLHGYGIKPKISWFTNDVEKKDENKVFIK
jgi:hypothetical protein